MKRIFLSKSKLAIIFAVVAVLMLGALNHSFAFRAPDTRDEMGPSEAPDASLAPSREGIRVESKPWLKSILIRNVNEPVQGDAVQAAKDIVQDLMSTGSIGFNSGRQSLTREGSGITNNVQIAGFKAQLRKTQVDDLGYQHIRIAQTFQGLPVVGAEIIVHINDKDIIYQINGKYLPDIKVAVAPSIDAVAALKVGLDEQEGKPGLHVSKEPSLVIYGPHLAYHYVLSHEGADVGQWWYYVDAHTGKLIYRYNNIKYAAPNQALGYHTTVSGSRLTGEDGTVVTMTGFFENLGSGNYFLYNFNDLWGIYDEDAFDWEQQASSNWGTTDRAAVSAGHNFADTQTYVFNVLGRNSFDDAGAFARANVHTGTNYVNAYWDGSDFHFGDGDGVNANALTVLDVAGHEYGHALTQYTSNLIYSYESGALNEAYSDIHGCTVEFYTQPDGTGSYPNATPGRDDWLMGEDCWLSEVALRDIRDPQRYQLPSYYHGTYWYYGSGDNGGVHYNNGPACFAYYLLAVGGSGTNDGHPYGPITGIGEANAAAVALRANYYYHISSDQYSDAREHWISAAADLGQPTATVEDVWTACGVEGGGGGPLIESFASPSFSTLGLDYDAQRGGVWIAAEDGNIYLVDVDSPHTVLTTVNLVGVAIAADGNSDGVCVLSNGNLLLADYNGDLSNIDDYLFEIDPDTATLVNYWPVDGAWNTSTDGTYIDTVIDVEIGPNGHAFVTSVGNNSIYEIALVPGSPGTWSTVTVHSATTVSNALGIDRIDCPGSTGWLVSDYYSTTVAFLDDTFATTSSFAANHDSNSFNSGVTAITEMSGEAMHVWTTDFSTNYIGVFDSGVVCGGSADCNLINDGSFENGPPPASAWTEWSSSGYEWIVDPTFSWGIAAYNGTYAFWGGGYLGTPNSDYVEQSISIPGDAMTLNFMSNFYRPDPDDASMDYFYVKINSASVFTRQLIQANDTYPNWVEQSIDISAYAGQTVTLRFEVTSAGDQTGNVLVDYIRICTAAGLGDELAVDFGIYGLWHYNGSSWSNLAGWNPDGNMVEWSGGLAVDFGASYGLWNYDGSSWTSLAGWNAADLETYGTGLAADFDIYGLWYYNGSSWTSLAGWNAASMEEWSGGLAVDFNTYGLWNYNGSSWTSLAGWNPGYITPYGTGLAVDFDTYGLWYYNGSSWTNLAGWNPASMEEWSGGLAVDFGTYGLWNYNGSSWTSLAGWNPGYITTYGTGLAVDFDTYGLWYYNGSSWTNLAGWNAASMEEWAGGLAVDFNTYGLWNYNGSSWTSLAGWNPEDLEDVNLY